MADPIVVNVPLVGDVEFPAEMSTLQIQQAAAKLHHDAALAIQRDPNRKPASAEDFRTPTGAESALASLLDAVKGFGKGAAHTGIDLAEMAAQSRALPGISTTNLPPAVTDAARQKTAYTNTAQKAGGAVETLAELAMPALKGAEAIPTTAKAGAKFQRVMSAARNVPVDINQPGAVALRIQELADRGASMPMAVRKFLARVTDPNKGQMVYEEARDFASNISRLSANEKQRLTPVVAREVAALRAELNKAVAEAAQKAGKLGEYTAAMREYAQAMKIKDALGAVVEGAKKTLPYATAAGAGAYGASKLHELFGGAKP